MGATQEGELFVCRPVKIDNSLIEKCSQENIIVDDFIDGK